MRKLKSQFYKLVLVLAFFGIIYYNLNKQPATHKSKHPTERSHNELIVEKVQGEPKNDFNFENHFIDNEPEEKPVDNVKQINEPKIEVIQFCDDQTMKSEEI